ncbi:MAG: serine hydrolase domain-containing protein, partial [Bacteroidota bacterium]
MNIGLLCGMICLFSQCKNPNPRIEEIDDLFSKWNNQDSPGCSVWVYHNGKIAYKKSFGMANIADSIPIESTTQFHVASITKQFTGMAIAILEDRGLINKDEEIIEYIAEIPNYGASISIRNLLNHTSGIPDYQYLEDLAGIDGHQGISRETFFDLLHSKASLNNQPGERYIYSNSNYVLLALIVEKVAHMTFPEFVKKEIFAPLNMNNSEFASEGKLGESKRLAYGYGHRYQIEQPSIKVNTITGDGGIVTNVDDLGLWVKGLITQKLPATISLIQRPSSGHYNYGLQYFRHNGLPTISHGGVHFGFRSNILIFPDQDFIVIILANIDNRDFFYNNYSIADILLKDSYKKVDTISESISEVATFIGKFTNKYFDEVVMIESVDSNLLITNYQKEENYTAFQSDENAFISLSASGQRTYLFNETRDSLEIVDYDGSTKAFHKVRDFHFPSKLKDLAGTYLSQDIGFKLSLTIDDKGI